jgi:glycine/D-amino acid oxidase-like deaminating enzyme
MTSGRNGGHLTPNPFLGFRKRSAECGTDEALRSLAIERYTVSALLEILESEGLANAVDLVEGGHITMALTERDFQDAQDDYHAARAAGVDLHRVEWLSKGEMIQVRRCFQSHCSLEVSNVF